MGKEIGGNWFFESIIQNEYEMTRFLFEIFLVKLINILLIMYEIINT